MSEPRPAALAHICGLARMGTIVHIGAGEGTELADYLATRAERIVLVEPNPDLVADLEYAAEGDERVRVLALGVSDKAGLAPLHLFNFSALSSLRSPSGLHELFPGLRSVGEPEVETLPLADVLQQAEIDQAATNILVIDAPGEEGLIVRDLIGSKWATQFSRIVLHAAVTPLYEGSAPVSELVDLLEDEGYRVIGEDGNDPDFPQIHLRLETLVVENRRLAEALERADSKAADETAGRVACEQRAAALDRRCAGLAEQLEQQRLAEQEDRNRLAAREDTISDLQTRIAELEEAVAEGKARLQRIAEEVTRGEAQMDLVRDFMLESRPNRPGPQDPLRRSAG